MSEHRPLTARAEAAVARARRLAEEHQALLAAVRQSLREGSPPREPTRPPERI
ncbi:hypothetical protein [Methylobacterium sp. ID0610]|uniref:hypothetical protein n=1 Tax=Methylobacterium carpenticola TaxID=3344827 RepID=UPI0036B404CB